MPARMQEALIGWGFRRQTDIATANLAAGIWRLGKLNAELNTPRLATENDAEELGKGHEFATQVFQTAWDVSGRIEKYLSSDFAAWAMAFSLGNVVQSGVSPNFTYTCIPAVPATDGIELPYFSYIEQIRPGANDVLDRMAVGCMVSGWQLTIGSGPGRANSKLAVDFVGSGRMTEPSGITLPAATAENLLASASLALSINGVDYVATRRIVSLEATWSNAPLLDAGFYPGSGTQNGAAVRGRIEYGIRAATLRFVARFEDGSDELTKLTNQTTGTAVLTLTYDANNSLQITWHNVAFSEVNLGDTGGLLTADVTCQPLYDATNGLLTAVAACNTDNIAA